jgi:hypothetical protein
MTSAETHDRRTKRRFEAGPRSEDGERAARIIAAPCFCDSFCVKTLNLFVKNV